MSWTENFWEDIQYGWIFHYEEIWEIKVFKANTRVGTLIVATIYLQLIGHKGLSPCDFDLSPKMKEPLHGIRFRTVPEILQAVDHSIRTINTTDAAKGILRLPHRWQRDKTMLVTTLKDSITSKHVSILYQL